MTMIFAATRGLVRVIVPLAVIVTCCYYFKTGVRDIPEGSVGLIVKLDHTHSQSLLQPGTRFVIPGWEKIKVVRIGPQSINTLVNASVHEGIELPVKIRVYYVRKGAGADQLAAVDPDSLVKSEATNALKSFSKNASVLNFLPVQQAETADQILTLLKSDRALTINGIQVIQIAIEKVSLPAELENLIKFSQKVNSSLGSFMQKLDKHSCNDNRTC